MEAKVIQIGTSKGIRIPASMLKHFDNPTSFDIKEKNDSIVLEPINNEPRAGWAQAFKKMHEEGDDTLLIDDTLDLDMLDV
jgi:antitoxin MazE